MSNKNKDAIELLKSALDNWSTCYGEISYYKIGDDSEQAVSDLQEAEDLDRKLNELLGILEQ